MNTSISYEVSNGNLLLLIVSILISVLVSFITGLITSERTFHQSIKGSTRVEWIESMRKVISEFYECIYLTLYDDTADSKTLAKLRNYAETIYLYCPKDIGETGKGDSNDELNDYVKSIFNKVETFYFEYKNKTNSDKVKRIDEIKNDLNGFTDYVRHRFKKEWEKSKTAK